MMWFGKTRVKNWGWDSNNGG